MALEDYKVIWNVYSVLRLQIHPSGDDKGVSACKCLPQHSKV